MMVLAFLLLLGERCRHRGRAAGREGVAALAALLYPTPAWGPMGIAASPALGGGAGADVSQQNPPLGSAGEGQPGIPQGSEHWSCQHRAGYC